MTKSRFHPQAVELRECAGAVGETIAPIERACVEVGARLNEALPGLKDVTALFETLSHSLESEEIGAATDDLGRIAGELTRAADELNEESRALVDLVEQNQAIGGQVAALHVSMRTLSSLVFSMKIEAAPLSQSMEDLTAFAEGVQRLAGRARGALDEYQATYAKLHAVLRSSCEAQAQFLHSHQDAIRSIASEIAESLGAVAELRRRTLAALREIGAASREIGERIGQCVVALQIGDSTRQRVEHAHAALGMSADCLEGEGPAAAALSALAGEATADDCERVAARLCRLQALQLDAALAEFAHEMATISASLGDLADKSGALARSGRALFGATNSEDGSRLGTLERKLAAARSIVAECRRARGVVDRATAAVVATMADLQQRTLGLSEIVADVTVIGTNALLKSTRLGDRGRGFSVIAQELRGYATEIVNNIKELPPMLKKVADCSERFGEAGRSLDAERLATLDARMSAAIDAFGANAKQTTTALERLGREADEVRTVVGRAVATLAVDGDVGAILKSGAETLDAIAARLGGEDGPSPEIDPLLDRLLRPAYSMVSERSVHDAFTGRADDEASSRGSRRASAGGGGDAILF
jgi:methyl-accepting chemotaxis protein